MRLYQYTPTKYPVEDKDYGDFNFLLLTFLYLPINIL